MLLSDPTHAPDQLLPCELLDHPQWHRGRQRYALWSIPVECPAVLSRMQAARELLGDWLQPAGERQAHITLFVCGFPCANARHDDDITLAQLDAQYEALARLQLAPFELLIGGLDSFASAAFLRVDAESPLQQLRLALAGITPEVRQAPYVPHLTLGLYRCAASASDWHRRTQPMQDLQRLHLPVRAVQLLSYEAAIPQGPLRIERQLVLRSS